MVVPCSLSQDLNVPLNLTAALPLALGPPIHRGERLGWQPLHHGSGFGVQRRLVAAQPNQLGAKPLEVIQ
jgi:hypothetical protein